MAKLIYDLESCSRCGGSGHYSYCQMYGTTCFKCGGSGKARTKAAKKSADAIEALKKSFYKLPADLKPGDRVYVDNFFKGNKRFTVWIKTIAPCPLNPGTYVITPTDNSVSRSGMSSIGVLDNIPVPGPLTAEGLAAVFALAKTLKGVSIVEETVTA